MDKENVVYVYKELYSAVKENEIITLAGKSMELVILIWSETNQTQIYNVFSHA